MSKWLRSFTFAWIFFAFGGVWRASAEVRLPKIIGEHSVLQRRVPIHIWGWAAPEEQVSVSLHSQSKSTEANTYGEWSVWLQPEQAGGPYTLTVKGSASDSHPLSFSDILIGDVWVVSGQSNMEIPLRGFPGSAVIKNADAEIASANRPQIRLLLIDHKISDTPTNDIGSGWTLCTPLTATEFSAVAYFFGREISNDEHVPIGLIDSTWGGTPIESWMSLDALSSDASLMPAFAFRARFADEQSRLAQVEAAEKREDEAAAQAHQPKPKHPWHPAEGSWLPAALYNGMIAPLTPYSIKGFLWYQGETNSAPERAPLYARLFPVMIADWRAQWRQGNLPFLYVQISSFHSDGENWGIIRDAQRRTLAVANTAMAVSIDVGETNNVHPADKQSVAARLALAAHGMVYHDGSSNYAGPLFRQATTEDGGMRVWFDNAAGGLRVGRPSHSGSSSSTSFESAFELAGDDRKFSPAHAVVEGETVLVTSSAVRNPRYVRYAWDNESMGGLYNQDGLPASTFTSE
ncbi:sialate O-acetylesterase [Granulicella mallensis]|uniref:Sialate O-acetylesterase n=1 Tax=Granulicella mallensis TaxID=940614 RepID=A0A7W7ZL51_9BACT|nr:sialate O-acetylesterase [Granulicella mallensis]MBB5061941.1 sialate O-acetylesterase [Granulicella mallensis]